MKLKKLLRKINFKTIIAVVFLICVFYVGSVTFPLIFKDMRDYYYGDALNTTTVPLIIDNRYSKMLDFDRPFLQNKGFYINMYGLMARMMGQRYINERIKLDNGHLTELTDYEDTDFAAGQIRKMYNRQSEKGKDFLFVLTPNQIPRFENIMPAGYTNKSNDNADELMDLLREMGVPALDLRESMRDEGMSNSDAFFITDHHWKPQTGLWACKTIVDTLTNSGTIGTVDPMYTDINEYDVEVFEDVFLGSFGRRTGIFFAGIDDFPVITPKFETDFTVMMPYSEKELSGGFKETLIDYSKIERNFFQDNPYVAYGHADEGLIQYRNDNAPVDLKVLAVGDSFSHVVYIFLPLIFKSCDQLDMRYNKGDFDEYYTNYDPDIVLMLVNPTQVIMENTTYDFFNEYGN